MRLEIMLQSIADLSTYNTCLSVVLYRETFMLQSTADLSNYNACHSVVLYRETLSYATVHCWLVDL
jgi:hypothetical protein